MKKFNIVLLILFALSIALLAESNFSTNGVFRTRMMMYNADDDNGIGDPMFTHSYIDSRFRMSFINTFNEKIKGVLQIEIGDIIWGDAKKGGGFTTDGINIETKHAYLEFLCPKSKVNFRIGLQAWKEHRGLVLDGDMAAFLLSKNFRNLNVELGTAKFEENKLHKDDDVDIFFLNFTQNKYGIHNILRRSEGGDNIDVWFMPYFIHKMNEISLDITVIYNYGNYIETAAGDVTNNGYGVDIKATYENHCTASLEFLYTSGEDEDDSESTTIFKTAGEHYCNGLEIFGRGTFDNFGAGWFGPEGKDNLGLM
ncbi:MAG: hypothetical protein KAU01_09390, partial [Candidatus Cloacimonetes bacterium]|nr:hypothetical protein [Candidatus Cloacimonadota bacterium]